MLVIEVLVVLVLIAMNGLFALSELAVVSSRRTRLKTLAERGTPGAVTALALHNDSGRFLSTIQVGITLLGVLSGAFSGATLGVRAGA
jgi:putative hemolysin